MKFETFRRLDNHDTRIRHLEANESEPGPPGSSPFPFVVASGAGAPWASLTGDNVFICDGVDDEEQLLDAADFVAGAATPIFLSPGLFNLTLGWTHASFGDNALYGHYVGTGASILSVSGGWGSLSAADVAVTLLGEFERLTWWFIPDTDPASLTSVMVATDAVLRLVDVQFIAFSAEVVDTTGPALHVKTFDDLTVSFSPDAYVPATAVVKCQQTDDVNASRGLLIKSDGDADYPTILDYTAEGAGQLSEVALHFSVVGGQFASGHRPILMEGGLLSQVTVRAPSFTWTGVDGIVEIIDDDSPYSTVDVSSFVVASASAPPVLFTTASLATVDIGGRIHSGNDAQRPAAADARGAVYVNTQSGTVLQWSNGSSWVNL